MESANGSIVVSRKTLMPVRAARRSGVRIMFYEVFRPVFVPVRHVEAVGVCAQVAAGQLDPGASPPDEEVVRCAQQFGAYASSSHALVDHESGNASPFSDFVERTNDVQNDRSDHLRADFAHQRQIRIRSVIGEESRPKFADVDNVAQLPERRISRSQSEDAAGRTFMSSLPEENRLRLRSALPARTIKLPG